MISLTCTHCKTVLTMDEAFAGGVCRCQHCGTIQTVPSHAKQASKAQASAVGQKVTASKPLFRARGQSAGASGLDELADVVASSGLSNSGLSSSGLSSRRLQKKTAAVATPAAPPPPTKPVNKSLASLPITIIVLLLVMIGVGIWLATRHPDDESVAPPESPSAPAVAATVGPSFVDVPLDKPSVIYLLDRGGATAESFDALKAACFRSIELLGPSRKFQVFFWDSESEPAAYPVNGVVVATPDQIEAARRAFENLQAYGSSQVSSVLKKALARKPAAIVIATGKLSLDEKDAAALKEAAATSTKLYFFSIGDSAPPADLMATAKTFGGLHRTTKDALRQFAQRQ